ncbi:hypothetical protein [Bacillus toyonensis]|uniref:hypothetical protein n=1 Tax=Bacillus toyonensis TaxID=155322 RepID=UPI0038185890
MLPWFEKLVIEMLWKEIDDFLKGLGGMSPTQIQEKLRNLSEGETIATSPLVKVLTVDNVANTITFLIQGSISFGGISPFMRIEVVISRYVTGSNSPIGIKNWKSVAGDIKIEKENMTEGNIGFTYENNMLSGKGSLKLVPIQVAAGIYGGITTSGMVIGIDAKWPEGAVIPLGPSGLGLRGLGGEFAYNFVANLQNSNASAKDYVDWARMPNDIRRWKPGPINSTTVGVGVNTVLCTIADQGFVFELDPIGFAFLSPGVLIIGGKGILLRRKGFGVEGYFVVDLNSASLAMGMGVNVEINVPPDEIPAMESLTLLRGNGQLDAFCSFTDPTAWFFDLGTESKPVKLEILPDVPVVSLLFPEKADAYFRINHYRLAFGASISIGGSFRIRGIIQLIARLVASLHAYIGWDPLLVQAKLNVIGELGIKVWKFRFLLTGKANPCVSLPRPRQFRFEVAFSLNLPWPLPDVGGSKIFGEDDAKSPSITSPLQAGTFTVSGLTHDKPQKVSGCHTFSGRKWKLDEQKPWPDLELIVPFTRRVTDKTSKITGPLVSPSKQGGYDITEELTKLELFDLDNNTIVSNVRAVWADGPGGNTALLQVLGTDPYSWLTPHIGESHSTSINDNSSQVFQVFFGYGEPETFTSERRFHDVIVVPQSGGVQLLTWFEPTLPTRILKTHDELKLNFRDALGVQFTINQVVILLVIDGERISDFLQIEVEGTTVNYEIVGSLFGSVRLIAVTIDFSIPTSNFKVRTLRMNQPLHVYAIRYRRVSLGYCNTPLSKILLKPGRYRLALEGKSQANHPNPSLHLDSAEINWSVTQEFEVTYPDTLRPYIYYSTFGDTRLFAKKQYPWTTWESDVWNPTMFGRGFPLYQYYHIKVQFLVPYIKKIFENVSLKIRVAYEEGGEVVENVTITSTPDGTSSKLPQSQKWMNIHCGRVEPDDELVLTTLLSHKGLARLSLFFNHPNGAEVQLDEWTGDVSSFGNFREHLSWTGQCLTTYYNTEGCHVIPECSSILFIINPFQKNHAYKYTGASGINQLVMGENEQDKTSDITKILSEKILSDWQYSNLNIMIPYPAELSSPPVDWYLPANLVSHLDQGKLDATTGIRFARFASATGACFNTGGEPLLGIQDTVSATTMEAVVDTKGRPYALWIRTPEPVDWRRVTARLRIWHIEPTTGCPTGYAHRHPLDLNILILPSLDGSSAFLVGEFNGIATRLPRGEYQLTLTFDPVKDGLPQLRPSSSAGSLQETITLRFFQSLGQNWPRPSEKVAIPHELLNLLLKYTKIDPDIWLKAYEQRLSANAVEARILKSSNLCNITEHTIEAFENGLLLEPKSEKEKGEELGK